jgi:hypothetical protein
MPITKRRDRREKRPDSLTKEQRLRAASRARELWDIDAVPRDYEGDDWLGLRRAALRVLQERAHKGNLCTYTELTNDLLARGFERLDPHSVAMASLLGQLNVLELERGRPMISSIVVLKQRPSQPGVGFWNLAEWIGIDFAAEGVDDLAFWATEVGVCLAFWRSRLPG